MYETFRLAESIFYMCVRRLLNSVYFLSQLHIVIVYYLILYTLYFFVIFTYIFFFYFVS